MLCPQSSGKKAAVVGRMLYAGLGRISVQVVACVPRRAQEKRGINAFLCALRFTGRGG